MTSNTALQTVKRIFRANKAGHTGSLDPLATGVLPICLGEATKFSQYLLDADKRYSSRFCLGLRTKTDDAEGDVLSEQDASALTEQQVRAAMSELMGDVEQIPPMYSAVKIEGKPLYKLARKGIEVERKSRKVTISHFELLSFEPGRRAYVEVHIVCSKGTYIRSLAADLGEKLGLGAHVQSLRRVQSGPFVIDQCQTIEQFKDIQVQDLEHLDTLVKPVDSVLFTLPKCVLDEDDILFFLRGRQVSNDRVYRLGDEGDKVRVFRSSGQFIGLGEIVAKGSIAPKRLISESLTSVG